MSSNERKAVAETAVAELLREASGLDLVDLDYQASFPELGFDSLFLVQFGQRIKSQLKVRVTFRQLIEEIGNIGALIDYVAENLSDSMLAGSTSPTASAAVHKASAPKTKTTPVSTDSSPVSLAQPNDPAPPTLPQPLPDGPTHRPLVPVSANGNTHNRAALAQIIAQQNQLMSMQLQLLSGSRPTTSSSSAQLPSGAAPASPVATPPQPESVSQPDSTLR